MLAILASLLLAAAPAQVAPGTLPDNEVPRYLRGGEVAEWSRARLLLDQGQGRLAQGTSIVNTPRAPAKGAGFETPAEAKARGEAMIKEGEAQVQRATVTLNRLRHTAAVRYADMTKTVSETIEIAGYPWSEGVLIASLRAQKVARDAGMTEHHVIGAWSFAADGRPAPSAELVDDLRAAWTKAQGDRAFLQPAPSDGYRITPPAVAGGPASFAADWKAPSSTGQVALVWAEVYPVSATTSLVFVRVADANGLRILSSECFLTAGRSAIAGQRATMVLRDERSFLPRVSANAAWRLGYPREACHPLGAALLRHLCLRGDRIAVYAGDLLSDLLAASPRLDDRANALWKVKALPGTTGEFQVSAQKADADAAVEVGVLTLRVESDKPAAEPAKPEAK